ncbi:MAG: glycosyltransferase [Polyangiales bacterium]
MTGGRRTPEHRRPLRVGVLTTSYPSHPGDIAGVFVEGFARTLRDLGHDVRVVAPDLDHVPPSSGPPDQSQASPRVVRLRYAYPRALQRTFHRAGAPENLRSDPLAALGALTYPMALATHLARRAHAFDVLVSHWAVPNGLLAARWPRAPRASADPVRRVVVTHGADIHLLERLPLGRRIARTIAQGSDALTFVSLSHRERFERLVGSALPHATVLAMGIPSHHPASAHAQEHVRRMVGMDGRVVLALGRLVPIKGLDVLVRALAGGPDATLVIAGDGPSRASLMREAARVGVRVVLPGVITGDEKSAWLERADVLALPSRRLSSGREEGTPTVLLEAMLAGTPVVATDTGGIAELLGHGARGSLVPPDDVGALRSALDEALRGGEKTLTRARLARDAAAAQTWHALRGTLDALVRGQ